MVESMDYGFFWLYAGFLSCSCIFTYFFVPETNGVPLERVEELFGGESPAAVHPGLTRGYAQETDSQTGSDEPVEKQQVERRA